MRGKRGRESMMQESCVTWFRLAYPEYHRLLFAIPNGGMRSRTTAAVMKKEGLLAGAADLFLALPSVSHYGLFIELKTERGKQSESQKLFEQAVTDQGYRYMVIRSFDDFRDRIGEYVTLKPSTNSKA